MADSQLMFFSHDLSPTIFQNCFDNKGWPAQDLLYEYFIYSQ
jgi:hypothetical protein